MSCPAGLAKHEYVIAAVGYSRTWLSRFIGAGVAAVTVALKNLVGSAAADSAPRRPTGDWAARRLPERQSITRSDDGQAPREDLASPWPEGRSSVVSAVRAGGMSVLEVVYR
jgi:hypothetical protein